MKTMKRIRYYIGLSDNRGNPLNENLISKLYTLVNIYLYNCTIYKALRYYRGNSEETVIIEVIDNDLKELVDFEKKLKQWIKETNQDSFMKTIEKLKVDFINGGV